MISKKVLKIVIISFIGCWTSSFAGPGDLVLDFAPYTGSDRTGSISGSNASIESNLSWNEDDMVDLFEEPIFGGNGGNIELYSGVVVNAGDGSDGDLNQSIKELEPGEYNFRSVVLSEFPSSPSNLDDFFVTIKVRGRVIIRCQYIFYAIIQGDYSYGPPCVEIYAGHPTPPPSAYLFGGEPCHKVLLDMGAPDGIKTIDGGSLIFRTSAVGQIQAMGGIIANGGHGLNGGNGGNGGSITLYANNGVIDASCLACGGDGGYGVLPEGDGGCGGKGGNMSVKTIFDKSIQYDGYEVTMVYCEAVGGHGGNGWSAESMLLVPHKEWGDNGGHGGHGGNGGGIKVEAGSINISRITVDGGLGGCGGDGGEGGFGGYAGGQGGDGGSGGNGGTVCLDGISVCLRDFSGCGGSGKDGGNSGNAGQPSHGDNDQFPEGSIEGDGEEGGAGGDGGFGGKFYCKTEQLEILTMKQIGGGFRIDGGNGGNGGRGGNGANGKRGQSGSESMTGDGGNGKDGCNGGAGGVGGDGGPGGDMDMDFVNFNLPLPDDDMFCSSGGNGGDGGNGGYGGEGGYAGDGMIGRRGGDGGKGGNGGDAGDGGYGGIAGIITGIQTAFGVGSDQQLVDSENGDAGTGGVGGKGGYGGGGGDSEGEIGNGGSGGDGGNGGNGGDGFGRDDFFELEQIGGQGGDGGRRGKGRVLGANGYGGNGGKGGDACQAEPGKGGIGGSAEQGGEKGENGNDGEFVGWSLNNGSNYVAEPRSPRGNTYRWTIMYYSAADDTPTEDNETTIEDDEITRLNTVENWDFRGEPVRVIVQMDRCVGGAYQQVPDGDPMGDWDDTRIGVVEYDGKSEISTLFSPIGEVNTGSQQTLLDFIKTSHELYPAEHYMLIISGHSHPFKGVAFDDNPSDGLSTHELRNVLLNSPVDIDILFLQGCMGSSLEWLAAIYGAGEGKVKYYLAAENLIDAGVTLQPGFAIRLQNILNQEVEWQDEALEVAEAALSNWLSHPSKIKYDSVMEVRKYPDVRDAIQKFVEASKKLSSSEMEKLLDCALDVDTISNYFPFQKDIHRYMDSIYKSLACQDSSSDELCVAINGVIEALEPAKHGEEKLIRYKRTFNDHTPTSKCQGLSVHLLGPDLKIHDDYWKQGHFVSDTGWYTYLTSLINSSRHASIRYELPPVDVPDSVSEAYPVDLVKPAHVVVTSTLEHSEDVDYYSFQALHGRTIYARLATGNPNIVGLMLKLYGVDTETPLYEGGTQIEQSVAMLVDVPETGQYYISVEFDEAFQTEPGFQIEGQVEYTLELLSRVDSDFHPTTKLSCSQVEFGSVQINSTPSLESIEITNSGLMPLEIVYIHLMDGNYFEPVLSFPLPIRLEPNSTSELEIAFQPTTVGAYVDTMTLITNDPDWPLVELILTGTGVDEPDDIAPESSAQAWTAHPSYPSIVVSWSGWDGIGGSGIAWYDVYVSFDGGKYKLWQFRTTENSAVYPGQSGHSYAFYSIATDKAGNVEFAPAEPDTKIDIIEP